MKNYLVIIFCAVFSATAAFAKFPSPELQEIYPAGGQAGTEVEVTVSGVDLNGIEGLKFSNPDIKAVRIFHPKTKNWTEPRPKGMSFKVTIPKNVKPDQYDVRVKGYYGLSSPRIFQVSASSDPAEVNSESEKNNTVATARALSLESVANGKIARQNADYYKMSLKKGQRVLIHCWAIRLGSKLDAKLTIFNPEGNEIYNNNDYVGRDPMLDFIAPADGEYYVSVADQTWLGAPGYVYRMKVSGKPYIETIYPAVVQKGKTSQHAVYGRNLPGGKKTGEVVNGGSIEVLNVSIKAPVKSDALPLDGRRPLLGLYDGLNYQIKESNVFRLALSDHPNLVEKDQEADIPVTIPSEISGRFNQEEDIDQYKFTAKKGDRLWLEIFSDRQFAKSDPFMVIEQLTKDKEGKVVAKELRSLDDFVRVKTQGMYDIHSYDDGIELDIPADGEYRIVVGDNYSKQGVLHPYRIRLTASKPEFQLLTFVEQFHFYGDRRTTVFPGALQLRPEGLLPIRVRAYRKGGREFPISLRVEGLPPGVKALPANIFPGQEEAYIVLTSDKGIKSWTGNIRVFGSINDGKTKIEHEAVGATLNWSGTEITYGYSQRLSARRTHKIPLALLGEELPVPITLAQKEIDKVWEFKKNGNVKIPLVTTRTDKLKGAVTVMEFGAAHQLTFPFRIFLNGGKPLDLSVTYKPNTTTNLDLPGEGAFIMRGWADINYTTYRKGLEPAKALKTKVDAKVKDVAAAQSKADAEVKKSQKAIATQNAANIAATKTITAKEKAAKAALSKQTAAKVVAVKAASTKAAASKATLTKLTAANVAAAKEAKVKQDAANAAAAKVVVAKAAVAKQKVEQQAVAKQNLAKVTVASAAATKEAAAKQALAKTAAAKEKTAKDALVKLMAANANAAKAATVKETIAKQALAKETAAKAALAKTSAAKMESLKQVMKTADGVLKTTKTDLVEIKVVEKEIHAEFAQIEKLTKETKFRAGFFSQPVRYKVVLEEKKKK